MNYAIPTRQLPDHPDLGQLKRQAKELLEGFLAGEENAVAEVNRFYRGADSATFALHDAQLTLARSYGYDSWPKIKAYIDGVNAARFSTAVVADDVEQVRSILKIRPELIQAQITGSDGHSGLHYAVFHHRPEMVRALMENGANARSGIYPNTEATAPLTIALERGYDDIAAIIREVEGQREGSRTGADELPAALRQAFERGDEGLAIAALEQHPHLARFHMPGSGRTLLHMASAALWTKMAAWLLGHGASVNEREAAGFTPLDRIGQHADATERAEKMEFLAGLLREHGAEPSARAAVILGDVESLRAQQQQGTLVAPQDDQGWLLRLAVTADRPEILQLLLDFGLDPDARVRVGEGDRIEFTWGMPLYECVRAGKHAMAEMLLERGADANGQVYASGTPLSEAFGQRDEKMIALLEKYGGQPNPSMAGLYRRKDLAERLLARRGDTELPDDGFGAGKVAVQLVNSALRGGDPEVLQMGLDRIDIPHGDPRWNHMLTQPLGFWNHWIGPWCHLEWDRTTYLTCFRMILERCGPPNARLRHGTSILHSVVTMGSHVRPEERVAFATAALDAGARMDMRDDLLQSTPLGWACRWGREELVRLFLERGADPVEAGAEPWARPLAWAEKKGHRGAAALLREYGAE